MRISNMLKLFFIIIFSTAFIFNVTYFGSKVYQDHFGKKTLYSYGTEIGNVSLENKTKKQVAEIVQTVINKWSKETSFTFTYKEVEYEVDNSMFDFDYNQTVENIKSGKENQAVVVISDESLVEQLLSTSLSIETDQLDKEQLMSDLLASAKRLESGEYVFQLEPYFINGMDMDQELSIATVSSNKLNKELQALVNAVPTIELKEQSSFSLLDYLEEQGTNSYTDETLSIVATAIYKAILPTNISIIERNISEELPEYAELGYEAKISTTNNMDFVLLNENRYPYTLALFYQSNTLKVVLKGNSFLYRYNIVKENEQTFPPKTVIQYDESLATGEQIIKSPGKRGQVVRIYREIFDESDLRIKKELLFEDYYAPKPIVEVHSLIVPSTEDVPEEVIEDLETSEDENDESNEEAIAETEEKDESNEEAIAETEEKDETNTDTLDENEEKKDASTIEKTDQTNVATN